MDAAAGVITDINDPGGTGGAMFGGNDLVHRTQLGPTARVWRNH